MMDPAGMHAMLTKDVEIPAAKATADMTDEVKRISWVRLPESELYCIGKV